MTLTCINKKETTLHNWNKTGEILKNKTPDYSEQSTRKCFNAKGCSNVFLAPLLSHFLTQRGGISREPSRPSERGKQET